MKFSRGKDCLAFGGLALASLFSASCQQQISYPAPVVTSLSPTNTNAGQPAFTITVVGSHFTPASIVLWNGSARVSFFEDESHLTANILQSDVEIPGKATVTVTTPPPGGGTFQPPVNFTVNPVAVPVPTISSVSPGGVLAGSGALTLHVFGTNFVATSVVTVNGANRPTAQANSTQLNASITAADVTNAGTLQIAVTNPPVPNPPAGQAPGGGSSNIVNWTVANPVPLITKTSISGAALGVLPSDPITVTGAGLTSGSVVLINGSPRATTLATAATLQVTLTGGDVAAAGVERIQVMNPAPGGGTSNALPFSVNASAASGLPELMDYAFDGTVSNGGLCGPNCGSGIPTLATAGPSISTDGQQVIFASSASNLLANQSITASQIFTRTTCLSGDNCGQATQLLSTGPNGAVPNGPSSEPSGGADGGEVAFTSTATNLTNYIPVAAGVRQVYWEKACATASCPGAVLVSLGADGNPGNADSYNASISPDGEFVVFVSLATNLVSGVRVDGVTAQVYLRTICNGATPNSPSSTCTPTTYLISSWDGATPANAASLHPAVASGGGYVVFESAATNLGPGGGNMNTTPPHQEVFVQQVCQILTPGCTTPVTSIVSTPADGVTPADSDSIEPAISTDGRFVAFSSAATNLGAAANGFAQIYVHDTCTGATSCLPATQLVSTADGSTPANGTSEHPSLSQGCAGTTGTCTTGLAIAFATLASNLGPNVGTGVENIFVRNSCLNATGTGCTPGVKLASVAAGALPEPSNGNSLMPAISGDGHTVAFLSASTNLVSANTGGLEHMYLGATHF